MACKRPIEDPPPVSSSEEEEEFSEGNISTADEEEEAEEKTPLKRQKAIAGEVGSVSETEVNGGETSGLPSFIKDEEVDSYFSTQISSGSEEDNVDFWKDYPCLKESFEIGFIGRWRHVGCSLMEFLEMNAGVIGRKKLKEMEREWRQLRIDQLELYLKRGELVQDIAKTALDAINYQGD